MLLHRVADHRHWDNPAVAFFKESIAQGELDLPLFDKIVNGNLMIVDIPLKQGHCKALAAAFAVIGNPSRQTFDSVQIRNNSLDD